MDKSNTLLPDMSHKLKKAYIALFLIICFLMFCLIEIKGDEHEGEVASIKKVHASVVGTWAMGYTKYHLRVTTNEGVLVYAPVKSDLTVGDKIRYIETRLILSSTIRNKYVQSQNNI